jgi:hypothetical protein
MTEAEWLACDDPRPMAAVVEPSASDRKVRLFGCACCRRVRHLYDAEGHRAVEVAERLADQLATNAERRVAALAISGRAGCGGPALVVGVEARHAGVRGAECAADDHARHLTGPSPTYAMGLVALQQHQAEYRRVVALERAANVPALRDIFGNPFRPVTFSPEWRTDTAIALARQMYDSRDFSAMPILADALQDAACDNEDILAHCRCDGPHVRGCWVVDLVLGKE